MNLKSIKIFTKEAIIVSFFTVGFLGLYVYAAYEEKKDRFKQWRKTVKETRDDSRTDLLGE